MRVEITDRYYRVYTYQEVDRVPDLEFGYWPQTIRRWLREGLPLQMTPDETSHMFSPKLNQFLGLEGEGVYCGPRLHMNPPFEEKVIERKSGSVVMRGSDGIVAERYLHESDESSIPHFLDFPVKTPDDWKAMKQRFDPDDPARRPRPQEFDYLRKGVAAGKAVTFGGCGFYGQLRNWMGFHNLSLAFYDYPGMIHEMVDLWAELFVRALDAMPDDIPIDQVSWWEDMASRNGPFVSPRMFREFLQGGYHRVMEAAKKRGCLLGVVDCDGNPHDIVANWIEEGVNIMFPLEVAAGCDAFAWREEFGLELRLRGGIAKAPLVRGRAAIDAEMERIKPLLDQGGYIPHLDHLVPPDISYDNYRYYREKKLKLIGK